MSTVITGIRVARAPDLPEGTAASDFRLIGFLLACGVPVMFWTSALALLCYALGLEIDERHLMGCALVVGAWCFMVASVVMSGRSVS